MTRYPAGFRFQEWSFTGTQTDHEEPSQVCELCGMTGLRYHFQIEHESSGETMEVGSECILRFDIAYYENGRRIDDKAEIRRSLGKRVKEMQRRAAIAALDRLADLEGNDMLKIAADKMRNEQPLPPKLASTVLWRMSNRRIDHQPSTFKVRLTRDADKAALKQMAVEEWRVRYLWPALTSAQRETAKRLGVKPPA